MNAPSISRPWEPGLFARSPAQERYRVAGGGLTLISLDSGDSLHIIDVEGLQPCELMAFDSQGRDALALLGLTLDGGCRFIAHYLARPGQQARRIQQALNKRGIDFAQGKGAASLWDADSPAGFSRRCRERRRPPGCVPIAPASRPARAHGRRSRLPIFS